MTLRMEMPELKFAPADRRRQELDPARPATQRHAAADGAPGIPVVSRTFGVPDGAKLSVVPGTTESFTIKDVDVFPAQGEALDADQPIPGPPTGNPNNPPKPDFLKGSFAKPPLRDEPDAYKTDAFVPSAPASGQILGQFARHHDRRPDDPGGAVQPARQGPEGHQHDRRQGDVRRAARRRSRPS